MKIGVKRLNDADSKYEFGLWCNEYQGDWVEHFHDQDGHVFPCTEDDLTELAKRIAVLKVRKALKR